MAILNPQHFLAQAERLIAPPSGRPRQVDIRRAISSAYYGVFHATLTAAADQFVGATKRSTWQYGLVYRSVDHGALRNLCSELKRQKLTPKLERYAPRDGFGADIQIFCTIVLELQEKRLSADYDPSIQVKASDARVAIRTAHTALRRLDNASAASREACLSLLIFRPR